MFSMRKCILRKLECTKNLSYRFMYTDVDISWFDNQSISVIKIAHLFQKWNSAECLFIFFFFSFLHINVLILFSQQVVQVFVFLFISEERVQNAIESV